MSSFCKALIFIVIAVLAIPLTGCAQATNPPTPTAKMPATPDTSIVWSDDFADGNLDGWEIVSAKSGDFFIEDEALKSDGAGGWRVDSIIEHSSPVTTGAWSFDLYRFDNPDLAGEKCYIGLFGNISLDNEYLELESVEPFVNQWWENPDLQMLALQIEGNTIYLTLVAEGKSIIVAQHPMEMDSWHHVDATRDEDGRVLVYLNGEQIFDYSNDRFSDSQVFYIVSNNQSEFTFDNIVVRDKVIEISPTTD